MLAAKRARLHRAKILIEWIEGLDVFFSTVTYYKSQISYDRL